MMTKTDTPNPVQSDLFKVMLCDPVAEGRALVLPRDAIDWRRFEKVLEPAYCGDNGRPSIPVRMMAGLTFLKHMFGLSGREVPDSWCENPYWQHFCGGGFSGHRPPAGQAAMSRWRSRAGEAAAKSIVPGSAREMALLARSQGHLDIPRRLIAQDRDTPGRDKIYSVREPQAERVAKGKAHRRHEFGVKAGCVTASKSNRGVGVPALPGNPHDGNTLTKMLSRPGRSAA